YLLGCQNVRAYRWPCPLASQPAGYPIPDDPDETTMSHAAHIYARWQKYRPTRDDLRFLLPIIWRPGYPGCPGFRSKSSRPPHGRYPSACGPLHPQQKPVHQKSLVLMPFHDPKTARRRQTPVSRFPPEPTCRTRIPSFYLFHLHYLYYWSQPLSYHVEPILH